MKLLSKFFKRKKAEEDTDRALKNIGAIITSAMDGDRNFRNKLKQRGVLDLIDREMYYAVNGYPKSAGKKPKGPWKLQVIKFFLKFRRNGNK